MMSAKSTPHVRFRNKSAAEIKYVDRGYQDSIVLIPGWANDYRIFATLDLRFNYLMPINFSPSTFEKDLLKALKKNNISKISLFGHSLGGFVASEFASKYPDLIDEVILVGIRKRYEAGVLKETGRHLKKNRKGYLYKIYDQCFSSKDEMRWFRENLLKAYCEESDLDNLLRGLAYLENAEIKPGLLNKIKKITIIHGEYDRIAPIQEAIDIKAGLPAAKFVCVKNVGHIPFLKEDFARFV